MRELGSMPMQDRQQRITKGGQNVRAAALQCKEQKRTCRYPLTSPRYISELADPIRICVRLAGSS